MIKLLKKLYFSVAYLFYIFGLLLLATTSKNKYDWMADINPSFSENIPQDSSGNIVISVGVILFFIIITQLIIIIAAKKTWVKSLSGASILLIFSIWLIKFQLDL